MVSGCQGLRPYAGPLPTAQFGPPPDKDSGPAHTLSLRANRITDRARPTRTPRAIATIVSTVADQRRGRWCDRRATAGDPDETEGRGDEDENAGEADHHRRPGSLPRDEVGHRGHRYCAHEAESTAQDDASQHLRGVGHVEHEQDRAGRAGLCVLVDHDPDAEDPRPPAKDRPPRAPADLESTAGTPTKRGRRDDAETEQHEALGASGRKSSGSDIIVRSTTRSPTWSVVLPAAASPAGAIRLGEVYVDAAPPQQEDHD